MSAAEGTPVNGKAEAEVSDVSGAVHAGQGDVVHVQGVELAATRVAARLRRALSAEEETREQLVQVLQHVSALQAQLGEWTELHHILHELLAAFSPFYANLRALGHAEAGPTNERALLRGWRPCQTAVDRLKGFESCVEHIQVSRQREGRAASRPDWGARIGSLRREVEGRLREEKWNTEGLIDLADEFSQACDCYLSVADRELGRAIENVQRLTTYLLGGLL
jgi:hypothetical protein